MTLQIYQSRLAHAVAMAILVAAAPASSLAENQGDTIDGVAAKSLMFLADGGNVDTLKQGVINQATASATGAVEQEAKKWLPTFEIGMQATENSKPLFNVLGLMPLTESEQDLTFTQGSLYYIDGRTTLNLGLGYRVLSDDDTVLYGVNMFYDHEFPYDHARASIGGEIRTTVGELNLNYYEGQSDWKDGANGLQEKAMGGYDIEAGIALPYMPGVKAYARHFRWNAVDGVADVKGNRFSLAGDVYPGFNVEVGRTKYDGNAVADADFVKFTVNLVDVFDGAAKAKPLFSDEAWKLSSMREHRYDKVRRENIIQKQTRAGSFTATVSGV